MVCWDMFLLGVSFGTAHSAYGGLERLPCALPHGSGRAIHLVDRVHQLGRWGELYYSTGALVRRVSKYVSPGLLDAQTKAPEVLLAFNECHSLEHF